MLLVSECTEQNKALYVCVPVYLCHMKTPIQHFTFEKNIVLIIITGNLTLEKGGILIKHKIFFLLIILRASF